MSLVRYCSGAGRCYESESWLAGFISVFIKRVWPVGSSWLNPGMGQVNILRNNFFQTKADQYAFVYIIFFPFDFLLRGWEHMLKFLFWVFQKEIRCVRTLDFQAAQTSRTSECFWLCLHRNSFLPHHVLSYLVSITSALLWRRGNAG